MSPRLPFASCSSPGSIYPSEWRNRAGWKSEPGVVEPSENGAELPLLTTVQGGLGLVWLAEESVLPAVTCCSVPRGPVFWERAEVVHSNLCFWEDRLYQSCIGGWKIPQPFSSFSLSSAVIPEATVFG